MDNGSIDYGQIKDVQRTALIDLPYTIKQSLYSTNSCCCSTYGPPSIK